MKRLRILLIGLIPLLYFACGDEETAPKPSEGTISVTVVDAGTGTGISGANVILFNADSGDAIDRVESGSGGKSTLTVDLGTNSRGNFALRVSAQGYHPAPPDGIAPVPFSIEAGASASRTVELSTNGISDAGKISGATSPALANVLVIAEDISNAGNNYSSISGPDGSFVIYNIPYGEYTMKAYLPGYALTNAPAAILSSGSPNASVTLTMNPFAGGTLSGNVSFLATTAGIIDVTLLDGSSGLPIPGMSTMLVGTSYTISNIPPGNYRAWASFRNDGYVMDPDWLSKNAGKINIGFTNTESKTVPFSVTGAISILSPSNPLTNLIPFVITNTNPVFSWSAYSSTKEYIVEVRDINGNRIWGGFENNGTINHAQILAKDTSITFNFDGSATGTIVPGKVYRWRVWADNDTAAGIQGLISSSEDQRGLFILE